MPRGGRISKMDREKILTILNIEWDPIGCGIADEYDSYLPSICRLLESEADLFKLAAHLDQLESVSMGLTADSERNRRVARQLLEIVGQ